ncbi:hypothetical protein D3C72_2183570 [compost metagenome]
MEYEVRFAFNTRQTLLQACIQRVQALIKGLEVALVTRRVGGIGGTQIRSHFRRDDPGVDRR